MPPLDVLIYEPTQTYHNTRRTRGVDKLTFARASVADLVRRYEVLGFDCTNIEIQKLAWFLEQSLCRLGLQSLDLQFTPARYGPYSDRLRHLLNALDGTYLLADKRLADAGTRKVRLFPPRLIEIAITRLQAATLINAPFC